MKIAFFTDTYRPEINGVVTSIDTYRRELERQGHEVYVFAPRYFGKDDPDPRTIRFPSIPFPFPLMKERRLSAPGNRGLRTFRKLGIDLIHSQVPANMGVLALLCSWFWRIPHIHTYHTHYMEYIHYMPFPQSFARRAIVWIARHFCGRCQCVVAPSETMAQVISSYGVDCPIRVIPTGIDLSGLSLTDDLAAIFRSYGLRNFGQLEGKVLLSSVGRLGREKNIGFLLRALHSLKTRGVDAHLIMIGDGPDRRDVESEIVRLGLDADVTLTGYLTREDVLSVIRQSRIFVFASQTETQGLVLLESMAVGTPVVALQGPGITDLMHENIGGFATENNVELFSGAVQQLVEDDELRETKSQQALARAQEWSVTTQATRLVGLYRESMAEFSRHGVPRYRHRRRY